MLKRMLIMLGLFALFVAALAGYKGLQFKKMGEHFASFKMPPVAVTTAITKGQTWRPTLNAVGSLKAVQGVNVSTDLAGIIREIAFESGTPVKAGDLLVKFDTTQEEAQLKAAQASVELAKLQLNRQRDLLSKRATSQAEFDSASADADKSIAMADEIRALIARKTIYAPFDGVLGIRKANIGQYMEAGKGIVSLESQDPIYVEFSIPQQELATIAIGKSVHLNVAGFEGKPFEGKITAINSRVEEASRNIQVEGTIDNKEGKLRGGMFAQVAVLLPEKDGVLSVPASSIVYAPYGDSVFIVKDKKADGTEGKHVVQQFVKLGNTRGDQVAILTGLKEGDEVVSAGGFKLMSGAEVKIDNSVEISNEENPTPPET